MTNFDQQRRTGSPRLFPTNDYEQDEWNKRRKIIRKKISYCKRVRLQNGVGGGEGIEEKNWRATAKAF